jgi:very-short-patch-repair endonuclease
VGEFDSGASKFSKDQLDEAVREFMRRQLGNVSRRQLLGLGMGNGAIQYRLRAKALAARYDGIYCQTPARQDPPARIAAAVLAGGPHALASHSSAAHLWGFIIHWAPPPEITLTQGDRRPRHILTHHCQSLSSSDKSWQRGVKVTSRARTVLDLAPALPIKQLTRIVQDARHDHHLTLTALRDVITRNPYHPGAKLLTPFVEDPSNPTDSEFEDAFRALIKRHGLPEPLINIDRQAGRADVYFPDHGLIVELDGWEFHKDRYAFETDRERDAENLRVGDATVRLTRGRFDRDADREITRLREILDRLEKPGP